MLPQEKFEIYDLWDCFWWLLRPHIRQTRLKIRSVFMIIEKFQEGGGEASRGIAPGPPPPPPLNKSLTQ